MLVGLPVIPTCSSSCGISRLQKAEVVGGGKDEAVSVPCSPSLARVTHLSGEGRASNKVGAGQALVEANPCNSGC